MGERVGEFLQRHIGSACPWCDRVMVLLYIGLAPTRDHYPVPKSKGGTETIVICETCNVVKGDMSAEEWHKFRLANPKWWTESARDRRMKRNGKREAARTAKWGPRRGRVIRQAEKPSTPMAEALAPLLERGGRKTRIDPESRPRGAQPVDLAE